MLNRAGRVGGGLLVGLAVGAVIGIVVIDLTDVDLFGKCPPGALSASMADVLDNTKYSWDALLKDVAQVTYDDRGESNHPLFKGGTAPGAKGSIQRSSGGGSRKESCFDNTTTVVAVIQSTEDLDPYLGIGTTER
jgi:hypothetical protein